MTALTDAERRTLVLAASFSAVTVFAAWLYVRSQTRRLESAASKPQRLKRAESAPRQPAQPDGDNVPRFDSAMVCTPSPPAQPSLPTGSLRVLVRALDARGLHA